MVKNVWLKQRSVNSSLGHPVVYGYSVSDQFYLIIWNPYWAQWDIAIVGWSYHVDQIIDYEMIKIIESSQGWFIGTSFSAKFNQSNQVQI